MKKEEIENLRESMGTLPSQNPQRKTEIIRGCEKLAVSLIDYPKNPYKAIVAAATATWGDNEYKDKWPSLTPENRFRVVLAALSKNTLPQSLESVNFTFKVIGTPRHCFDQHARARIGSTFYSIGSRDNNKLDSSFILYTKLYDNKAFDSTFLNAIKLIYQRIIKEGQGSWQIARAVLPMSYHHPYHFSQNYLSLQDQCARRMQFCEEEFIVGVHWLLRERIKEKFPLLAEFLRPGCDSARSCTYSKNYYLSNVFGCLFSGCGRWQSGTEYSTFNESCTDKNELEKQLKIKIPDPKDWKSLEQIEYNDLDQKDKKLFEEE